MLPVRSMVPFMIVVVIVFRGEARIDVTFHDVLLVSVIVFMNDDGLGTAIRNRREHDTQCQQATKQHGTDWIREDRAVFPSAEQMRRLFSRCVHGVGEFAPTGRFVED